MMGGRDFSARVKHGVLCLLAIGVASPSSPALAGVALAGPSVSAVDNGDGTASVFVLPDPGFVPGSLAVELAIELSGGATLSSAVISPANVAGAQFVIDNPGINPFTGGVSFGLVDAADGAVGPGDNQIFVAYGSNVAPTADPVPLLDISFSGSGTLTIAGDSLPFAGGDVVAQGGGFDALVNIPELSISLGAPPSFLLGDADFDGDVDGDDLIVVQTNFLATGSAPLLGDADGDGDVDGDDLIAVQTNFLATLPASVPEPCSLVLAGLMAVGFATLRR